MRLQLPSINATVNFGTIPSPVRHYNAKAHYVFVGFGVLVQLRWWNPSFLPNPNTTMLNNATETNRILISHVSWFWLWLWRAFSQGESAACKEHESSVLGIKWNRRRWRWSRQWQQRMVWRQWGVRRFAFTLGCSCGPGSSLMDTPVIYAIVLFV